jgi:hypothetical protein
MPGDDYAESVAFTATSSDGSRSVSARLARLPARGTSTLWAHVFVDQRQYTLAEEIEHSRPGVPTDFESEVVRFELAAEDIALFERDRDFGGSLKLRGHFHETPHPPLSFGDLPITIEARFDPVHQALRPRPGRIEVFGRADVSLTYPGGSMEMSSHAKWHEQTGDRPSFAPRFTYLELQSDDLAVLAVAGERGAWGAAILGGAPVGLRSFRIDEPREARRFEIVLDDSTAIEGVATARWATSVPIEGKRRPGSIVVASTTAGPLVGTINDWDPPA